MTAGEDRESACVHDRMRNRQADALAEADLLEMTGGDEVNPTFSLPCREVFARGQKPVQVAGPFPWGQRPAQPQPPQTMPAMKLSAVEMPSMRDALLQMPAGSKWEIALPADKAYGADPRTGFPPNVAVVFEVTLVSVK